MASFPPRWGGTEHGSARWALWHHRTPERIAHALPRAFQVVLQQLVAGLAHQAFGLGKIGAGGCAFCRRQLALQAVPGGDALAIDLYFDAWRCICLFGSLVGPRPGRSQSQNQRQTESRAVWRKQSGVPPESP